jgi:hypothetical protein
MNKNLNILNLALSAETLAVETTLTLEVGGRTGLLCSEKDTMVV